MANTVRTVHKTLGTASRWVIVAAEGQAIGSKA